MQFDAANVWVSQIVNAVIFFATAYGLGLLVQKRGWPVGYTRKMLAVTLYFAPLYTGYLWQYGLSAMTLSVSAIVFTVCLGLMSKPFRSRSPFLNSAFACVDRPEDRPFTIVWLWTSLMATWLVMILWAELLPAHYLFIALFVSGIGDALAEPVGLRYGRHKYTVRALGTDRKYVRSLEGSACVFVCAVIGVLLMYLIRGSGTVSDQELWLALLLFPAIATLAEARSPHTWDQPFNVLSCGMVTGFIVWVTGRTYLFPWVCSNLADRISGRCTDWLF